MALSEHLTQKNGRKRASDEQLLLERHNFNESRIRLFVGKDPSVFRSPMAPLKDWPPALSVNSRYIANVVHGPVYMPEPLDAIMNTKEFFRLHSIRQLGFTHLVYPDATVSRYSHSIGTCALAFKVVEHLRKTMPWLKITSADHLCVSIGGLLHDVGHGPFSHFFDGPFRIAVGGHWKHEEMSVELIRRIMYNEEVKKQCSPYLGTDEVYEQNVTFIVEVVSPPPFRSVLEESRKVINFSGSSRQQIKEHVAGLWTRKGRGIEKSFLYDIVSNEHHGYDVDKLDYLLRDSKICNVDIDLNNVSVKRIIQRMVVGADEWEYPQIAFSDKIIAEINSIGVSRKKLHSTVYQHKNVGAFERMATKAFKLASPHLKYLGDDGKFYDLAHVYQNAGAFLRTNDDIFNEILNSTSDELMEARKLLEMVESRKKPLFIKSQSISPTKLVELRNNHLIAGSLRDATAEYLRLIEDRLKKKFKDDDIIISCQFNNRGLDGVTEPLGKALFLRQEKNSGASERYEYLSSEELRMMCTPEPTEIVVLHYSTKHRAPISNAAISEELDKELEKCMNKSPPAARRALMLS